MLKFRASRRGGLGHASSAARARRAAGVAPMETDESMEMDVRPSAALSGGVCSEKIKRHLQNAFLKVAY